MFNSEGELVALTVAGLFTREGISLNINYIIPIDDALSRLNIKQKSLLADVPNDIQEPMHLDTLISEPNESGFVAKAFTIVKDWLDKPIMQF